MMRACFGSSTMASVVAFAFIGCNSILDNRPAIAEDSSEATAEPLPGTSPDSGDQPQETDASASVPDAGTAPSPKCPVGQQLCSGSCVSMIDPLYGCGNPSCSPCPSPYSSMGCQGGKCVVKACNPGHADCNANGADGCESDLSKALTCGACGTACTAAAPLCAPAGPSFQCTNGCTPAAPLKCGDRCVVPTDPTACGPTCAICPVPANAVATCAADVCGSTCSAGFGNCDLNPLNGCEATLASDPLNCGVCGTVCPIPANTVATCAADVCGSTCKAGFGNCDLNPLNGCESTLASDPLNCGVCGKSCLGRPCVIGVCLP